MFLYLGNEALSLSKYSPRAFWIFPRRSDKRSSCFWTLGMLTTSITKGERVTFFIRAKNSVLTLNSKQGFIYSKVIKYTGSAIGICKIRSLMNHFIDNNLPLEAWSLNRKQSLYVSTSGEYAFQVHPSPLYINPDIKQGIDAIQFVFPGQSILFKLLRNT